MNTFNSVFLAVKEYCSRNSETPAGVNGFAEISYKADVPFEKLDFYLSTLQDLGLIKYSWVDKTVILTKFGKMQERLFA